MTNILFVDDDRLILSALRRMLRHKSKEWKCAFADSAQNALQQLEAEPYDVVVSDIRMPGMDGAAFLAEVRELYPRIVRVVLSGQADRSRTVQATASTHRILLKPCEPERLCDTVQRLCDLAQRMPEGAVSSMITGVGALPSDPAIYDKLAQVIGKNDTSSSDIAEIVAHDLAMSAKALQIANSFFYDSSQDVACPMQAVERLGKECLQEVFESPDALFPLESTVESKQHDTIARVTTRRGHLVGCAKAMAEAIGLDQKSTNVACSAASLMGIGEIAVATLLPDSESLIDDLRQKGHTSPLAEVEVLGATYAELSSALLGLWGLPQSLTECIANIQHPSRSSDLEVSSITAAHLAAVFVAERRSYGASDIEFMDLDHKYLDSLRLTEDLHALEELSITFSEQQIAFLTGPQARVQV